MTPELGDRGGEAAASGGRRPQPLQVSLGGDDATNKFHEHILETPPIGDFAHRPVEQHPAAVDDHQAVAHPLYLVEHVAREDHGAAGTGMTVQHPLHRLRGDGVEP